MADDLDRKIKQIADMFGVSDTSGLRNIVDSIAPPGSGARDSTPEAEVSGGESTNFSPPPASPRANPNLDLMSKASEMMGMFNNVKDSRITLLNSVQPFLGTQRQQRLGGAIQLLKVINILSTISPNINRNTKG